MLGIELQQTRVYQEAKQEGQRSLIQLLLNRQFGELPDRTQQAITQLESPQLEALAIALSSFSTVADLEAWLNHS